MNEQAYMDMLYVIDAYHQKESLIIDFPNGLKVKCKSFTGIYETDTEPEDEDYIGEYATVVSDVETLVQGNDNSVSIFNNCIEISLANIPKRISLENDTILWQKQG